MKTARRIRFPGIVRHARELGCSRIHLYFLLRGDRVSPRLIKRYHSLLAAEKRATRGAAK